MKRSVVILSALACLSAVGAFGDPQSFSVSKQGGEWHAPSTWSNGRIPPAENDLAGIEVGALLILSTGSVTAAGCFLHPEEGPLGLRIEPLAHLNLRDTLQTRWNSNNPVDIDVEGSLTLQGGAHLYGNVALNITGGFVQGMGRLWYLMPCGTNGPAVNIRDGGSLTVRGICMRGFSTITLDHGNARFDSIEFAGAATINIRDGSLTVSQITCSATASIVLGKTGQLLLAGQLDADSLHSAYPGVNICDETGKRRNDSLAYTPGTGRFEHFTCITLPPEDTDSLPDD